MSNKLITWDNIRTKKYKGKLFIHTVLPLDIDKFTYDDKLVRFAAEAIAKAKANMNRLFTINNHLNKLYVLVYSWPTKYYEGFTDSEIKELLAKFPDIHKDKFDKALIGNTCVVVDSMVISYHCDILKALRCGIENRNLTMFEWD